MFWRMQHEGNILIDKLIKKKFPKTELALMHCVLSYPTKYSDANLNLIKILKKNFLID